MCCWAWPLVFLLHTGKWFERSFENAYVIFDFRHPMFPATDPAVQCPKHWASNLFMFNSIVGNMCMPWVSVYLFLFTFLVHFRPGTLAANSFSIYLHPCSWLECTKTNEFALCYPSSLFYSLLWPTRGLCTCTISRQLRWVSIFGTLLFRVN